MTTSPSWPMFFCTRELTAVNAVLRKGDPFPYQDTHYIRGLGLTFGVSDAKTRPFHDLPYVATVDVQTAENEQMIRERGLRLPEVQKMFAKAA